MMLRRLRDLENWTIEGVGGDEVGIVENFYVDDLRWTVRYMVANTGGWLTGRQVLISPMSVRGVDEDRQQLQTNLVRDTVKHAPSAQLDRPITRGHEVAYSSHYGYSYYWMGGGVWGSAPTPSTLSIGVPGSEPIPLGAEGDQDASHLHSVNELSGYHIQAVDGEIGHVEDLMVDLESWTIRYMVIDTSNWIGGRTVLVSPEWVRRIDWTDQKIHVDMTREHVENSPPFDPGMEVDRTYEEQLYRYYERPTYWKR